MTKVDTTEPRVFSMVLAGGEGKRLFPLSRDRAKPAVPFGGHYRLIDFVLSNLVNAGYRKIAVLTQYKSHSLDVHLTRTWQLSTLLGHYVVGIPAQMRRGRNWYQGSADAIYQNMNLIDDENPDYVIVFGADHIYRMDPRQMLKQHIESEAGVTVAALRMPRSEAHQFGVIDVDENGRIKQFLEKPADPPGMPDSPDECLVSMGNYLFNADLLRELVNEDAISSDAGHDMGGDIVPAAVGVDQAYVYDFTTNQVPGELPRDHAYWRDVGTLDAYYDAHLDLVAPDPVFNLYNFDWPIHTSGRLFPPAKATAHHERPSQVENAMICSGAVVSGARIADSVVSPGSWVKGHADLEGAVILDGVEVGERAVLRRVIIDKNVVIPDDYQIGVDPDADRDRFSGRDDIVVTESGLVAIGKNAVLPE